MRNADTSKLISILERAQGVRERGIYLECHKKCDRALDDAYTQGDGWPFGWGTFESANIHLCPNAFNADRPRAIRIILHELTHYGDTKHDDYFDNVTADLWQSADTLQKTIPWMNNFWGCN
jgi:hypothetical protein